MQRHFVTALALLGAAAFSWSSASAASFGGLSEIRQGAPATSPIIKVHSRTQVHDMLHGYGYDRVVYKSKYYDGSDKPVYRFRACQGQRAYLVEVNWYGHIIDQYRAGRCHRHDW
jgi:hypothetical protein